MQASLAVFSVLNVTKEGVANVLQIMQHAGFQDIRLLFSLQQGTSVCNAKYLHHTCLSTTFALGN